MSFKIPMNKGNGLFQKVMIKNRDTSPMKPKEASNEVMKMEPSGTEVKVHCKIDVTLNIKYKSRKWLNFWENEGELTLKR